MVERSTAALAMLVGLGVATLSLAACSALWGFEEVHEEPYDAASTIGASRPEAGPTGSTSEAGGAPDAGHDAMPPSADAGSDACASGSTIYLIGNPTGGPCWGNGDCESAFPPIPDCPPGYVAGRGDTACGDPNDCASGSGAAWPLCAYYSTNHFGCGQGGPSPKYVMAISARECVCE